jgi:hypothetical protein
MSCREAESADGGLRSSALRLLINFMHAADVCENRVSERFNILGVVRSHRNDNDGTNANHDDKFIGHCTRDHAIVILDVLKMLVIRCLSREPQTRIWAGCIGRT